jgi:transcriptional regulator with XRE-family HTH domain
MSRVTYNQVETGKRDLKKSELESLAHIFEMSMAELVTDQSPQIDQIAPSHPLYKMIQAVLYILNRTAGKPNVGKIVLNKLLYFADFNHYEKYRESISGDSYIKMPM